MPRLSDLQLALLLEEIAAAMRIKAPVEDAMQRLSDRRLGGVSSVARLIADSMQRGEPTSQAIRFSEKPLVQQASAAVAACESGRDPSLLSQIAIQLRARHEHSRLSRLTWLYPVFLLVLAYAVAVLVMSPMVRANQGRGFQWSDWVLGTSRYLEHSWPVPLIIGIVVILLLVLWTFSRSRFPTPVRKFLFCQALADQLQHGTPESEAIRNAALMAGSPDLATEPDPTFDSPRIKNWISQAAQPLPNLDGIGAQELLVAQLRYASSVHSERARRQSYLWGTLFPRIAMVAIGGGLTIAYAWWVIRPIYQQVQSW